MALLRYMGVFKWALGSSFKQTGGTLSFALPVTSQPKRHDQRGRR
jgi:hypothetical protein